MNLRPPGCEILAKDLLSLTGLTRLGICLRTKNDCNFVTSILCDRYRINNRICIIFANNNPKKSVGFETL